MEKIYCGNKRIPSGYGRYGTRNECLKCGFGAAMMQYKWSPPSRDRKPPRRSRKGCYRPRRRPKEVPPSRSYSRNRRRRRRSPSATASAKGKGKGRKSHRSKINRWIEEEHRQRFGSRKRLSGRGKRKSRRKSPRRKPKKKRRKSKKE